MWEHAKETSFQSFHGYAGDEFIKPLIEEMDQALSRGVSALFADWEDITGYAPSVRSELTKWIIINAHISKKVYILTKSPTVKLGIRLANAALKEQITTYEDRSEFEQKKTERLQR